MGAAESRDGPQKVLKVSSCWERGLARWRRHWINSTCARRQHGRVLLTLHPAPVVQKPGLSQVAVEAALKRRGSELLLDVSGSESVASSVWFWPEPFYSSWRRLYGTAGNVYRPEEAGVSEPGGVKPSEQRAGRGSAQLTGGQEPHLLQLRTFQRFCRKVSLAGALRSFSFDGPVLLTSEINTVYFYLSEDFRAAV